MAKTATRIGSENIETVDISLLLLGLDKIKNDANQNLGKNEGLKKELSSKIDSIIAEREIKTINEKIIDLAQIISKNPETGSSSETGIMAKRIELATEELLRQHPKEAEELKKIEFKKDFEEEVFKINPKLDENQLKTVKDYGELIAENSFGENILDGQKNEALETNSKIFNPGRLESAWTDLKGVVNFLRKSPEEIKGIKEKYNSLKENLKGVNLPNNSKETRSFEKIMAGLNNPNIDQLFSKTKKYLGWADKVDKLTGGWLSKTVTDAGLKFASKIGNQAIQEFTTNSLNVIAEQGFQKGFTTVLNGILSGGVKAVTTTAEGLATGAKVAATGVKVAATGAKVAATGVEVAAGTAGGATTGGIATIVVLALEAVKFIKKGLTKIAEKLGISTKKFFEENFGKVGGKILGGIASVVALPALLIGTVSAVAVGPILIIVFAGLFGYQILQGGLISSLVPPKGANEYNEGVPIGDDYDLGVGISGDIVVPPTPTNFTRQDLINVAMSLKGNVYYDWGGDWQCIGPCPNWGLKKEEPTSRVDNKGKTHYYYYEGVDCSGFVRWVYYQLTKTVVVSGSADGMYFHALRSEWQFIRNENDLKPGDIAHRTGHVALYIGRDNSGNKLFIESFNEHSVNLRSDTVWVDGNKPMSFKDYIRPNVTFYND